MSESRTTPGCDPSVTLFFLHSVQSLVDKAHSACCSTFPQFPVHKVRSWCLIIFAFPLILLQFYSLMKVDPLCSCAHGHAGLGVMSIKLNGFERRCGWRRCGWRRCGLPRSELGAVIQLQDALEISLCCTCCSWRSPSTHFTHTPSTRVRIEPRT